MAQASHQRKPVGLAASRSGSSTPRSSPPSSGGPPSALTTSCNARPRVPPTPRCVRTSPRSGAGAFNPLAECERWQHVLPSRGARRVPVTGEKQQVPRTVGDVERLEKARVGYLPESLRAFALGVQAEYALPLLHEEALAVEGRGKPPSSRPIQCSARALSRSMPVSPRQRSGFGRSKGAVSIVGDHQRVRGVFEVPDAAMAVCGAELPRVPLGS